jgi:hypothetical protein
LVAIFTFAVSSCRKNSSLTLITILAAIAYWV